MSFGYLIKVHFYPFAVNRWGGGWVGMRVWVGVCTHTKKGREHVCALFASLSQAFGF